MESTLTTITTAPVESNTPSRAAGSVPVVPSLPALVLSPATSTGVSSGKIEASAAGAVPITPMTPERTVFMGLKPESISNTSTPCKKDKDIVRVENYLDVDMLSRHGVKGNSRCCLSYCIRNSGGLGKTILKDKIILS